jgi:hypothetical protein
MRARRGEAPRFLEEALSQETDACIEWPFALRNGYGVIKSQDRGRMVEVHALVCERTYGPRPEGLMALHGPCHNPTCLNKRHLRWGTAEENHGPDRVRDGTSNRGERHGFAKLTEREVREIRQQYDTGEWSYRSLAAAFGVCHQTVMDIVTRRLWSWLP